MKDFPVTDLAISLQEAVEFVWAEADMLDACDYDAWLALWGDGGHYVIPIEKTGDDFANMLNIAYDDAAMRKMRVERLQGGFSISAAPPAQTVRTLSRFVAEAVDDTTITLRCAEHVVEDKFGRQRIFAVNLTYTLVRSETGIAIRDKVARLLNSNGVLTSISYLF
ncbi:Anthranilate 1,2-dioxygenase small subunit [Aquimixticola soesokkakensis]|uniref:Anthranilate 1,2-dioxygenase small subunit n=1 Tax=Aquimixticola soesokkakensis TaxID=1519096 RepID=A0A1Y5TGI3_9RHOB|nr:aromatic-ring-hydroxylating dioxygenase subunit beta [Aquimixticola soesokkakensis]SLN59898.1 Anthranilate 1,2-dioxygenase small subunit [Aquimixticola soesokkakensis]